MLGFGVPLEALVPFGDVSAWLSPEGLDVRVGRAVHDCGYNLRAAALRSAYLALPGAYRVPFRVDLEVCLDVPCLVLLVGQGHLTFGVPWLDNRSIEDMALPAGKPRVYNNGMPLGRWVRIAAVFNRKSMQVLVDGEVRYASTRERYHRADAAAAYPLGITCTKGAQLRIRAVCVEEAGEDFPLVPGEAVPIQDDALPQRPTFEACIATLPPDVRGWAEETDALLKALRPLRFRRAVDKSGHKVSYVASAQGLSYAMYLRGGAMHHSLQWYIVTSGKPETWHRRGNDLEAALHAVAGADPALAGRIFARLCECNHCGPGCRVRTRYTYDGMAVDSCHGQIVFTMRRADFDDLHAFVRQANALYAARL